MDPAQARLILAALLRALSFLHAKGFAHTDVKPLNVLLTASGMPKLCDLDGFTGALAKAPLAGGPTCPSVYSACMPRHPR